MAKMDRETEKRVWERVKGCAEPGIGLRGLELRCRESAAAFRQLAQGSRGELRERLLALHRQEHCSALTIRGMRILDGEEPEALRGYASPDVPRAQLLAQAFRRSCQAQRDYAVRCAEGDYAPVFRRLAEQEAGTMAVILEMIARATVSSQ